MSELKTEVRAPILTATQMSHEIPLPIGTEAPILSLPITTVANERIKIDSMSGVEISISATNYQYTILYSLFRDGVKIASITVVKHHDRATESSIILKEVPSLTWFDIPPAGEHEYEIRITVSGTNLASVQASARALNAVIFP